MNRGHYKLHKFTIVTGQFFSWFIRKILLPPPLLPFFCFSSLRVFSMKISQRNARAINSAVVDYYCCGSHTPLAMARFPITSPPVARA